MNDCIFCQIIEHHIPSYKIYEDEHVYAFLDISQATKGHTLVVPKKHCRNILDADPETVSQVFAAVAKIAVHLKDKLHADGINVTTNAEPSAGQVVFHWHVHILPRYNDMDGYQQIFDNTEPTTETLVALAETIAL
ncbi:HIT family protein [Culicoidibacter larvae]|uniref:HIT family protein n=1 Tax=Culicoidibacter larvae TaxID=2579976 RepID=A0A5R8QDL1_9FIRM|nr:HIT family protein [Culicoidibacter larvae]TLG75355.1 HIT family protein [Culicoidibacter larvae]